MRWHLLTCALLMTLVFGCADNTYPLKPSLEQALGTFEGTVAEARNEITPDLTDSEPADMTVDPEEEADADQDSDYELTQPVQIVVAAAKDLATAAAGHPMAAEVDAILAQARELEQKAEQGSDRAEIERGLEQLSNQAQELKSNL